MREQLKRVQEFVAFAQGNRLIPADVRGVLGELGQLLAKLVEEVETLKGKS